MSGPSKATGPSQESLNFKLGEQQAFAYSPDLQSAISEVLAASFFKDELDRPDFSVIDFINQTFPDENSLVEIDAQISKMKKKINRIDDTIIDLVSKQSRAGLKGKHQLEEARTSIKDLFGKIQEIKTKSDNSERTVNDICGDIRDLDYAKRNLTSTTKALTNLQDIVQEMDHLKTMSEKERFQDVANLLEAVKEILRQFSDWKDIDRIKELQNAYDSIRKSIKVQVFNRFDHVDVNAMPQDQLNNLRDACLVIDSLGEESRKEFIQQWSKRQLGVYELKFKPGAEGSQLENVDKRYDWFMAWIQFYEEHQGQVFPPYWRVSESVAFDFCLITSSTMVQLLEKTKNTLKVNHLKLALKHTLQFENALSNYFSKKLSSIPMDDLVKELSSDTDPTTVAMVAAASKSILSMDHDYEKSVEKLGKKVMEKFKSIISASFEGYMYLYVENQTNIVQERFNTFLAEEKWSVEESAPSKVLSSARSLIDVFSKVRKRVATLNQSQAFFDIFGIFKTYLGRYADRLEARLVQADQTAQRVPSDSDEVLCCILINTGEYCSSMATTIQQVIASEISPKFKSQVDLEPEKKRFADLIAHALMTLSRLIETALEPTFIEMNKVNWERFASSANVSDASPYVNITTDYILERIPIFRKFIMPADSFKSEVAGSVPSPNYFQIICDIILTNFTRRYGEALRACRRISEAACPQLLTDLAQFKRILNSMPILQLKKDDSSDEYSKPRDVSNLTAPAIYLKKVGKMMEGLEKMIKVIWTSADTMVDTFKALLPNSSEADFISLMQLKGIPYADQHKLLDQMGVETKSPTRELVSRDWVGSSKSAFDNTTQTVKNALMGLNVFGGNN